MPHLDDESLKVVAAAQRYVKFGDRGALDAFDLPALKKADYQIGARDIDSGWRKALQDAIGAIENAKEVVEARPGIFGITLNVKELIKRARKQLSEREGKRSGRRTQA